MDLSYRQILVDGALTGLQGLDECFAVLYDEGVRLGSEGLESELIKRVRRDNYIPRKAKQAFADALLREYGRYVAQREAGQQPERANYGKWRGYPREQIPWFPIVDQDLCDGCGLCLRICATKALAPTPDGKVDVVDPFKCVVGCSSCANVCRPKAITFPPRSMLDTFKIRG